MFEKLKRKLRRKRGRGYEREVTTVRHKPNIARPPVFSPAMRYLHPEDRRRQEGLDAMRRYFPNPHAWRDHEAICAEARDLMYPTPKVLDAICCPEEDFAGDHASRHPERP